MNTLLDTHSVVREYIDSRMHYKVKNTPSSERCAKRAEGSAPRLACGGSAPAQ